MLLSCELSSPLFLNSQLNYSIRIGPRYKDFVSIISSIQFERAACMKQNKFCFA